MHTHNADRRCDTREQRRGPEDDERQHNAQSNRETGRPDQALHERVGSHRLPERVHSDAHQSGERQHGQQEHRVEPRRAHGDLAEPERVGEQWIERAEQDQQRRDDKQNVVREQERFARQELEAALRLQVARTQRIQQQRPAPEQAEQRQE